VWLGCHALEYAGTREGAQEGVFEEGQRHGLNQGTRGANTVEPRDCAAGTRPGWSVTDIRPGPAGKAIHRRF
jgi:hypothetical protein